MMNCYQMNDFDYWFQNFNIKNKKNYFQLKVKFIRLIKKSDVVGKQDKHFIYIFAYEKQSQDRMKNVSKINHSQFRYYQFQARAFCQLFASEHYSKQKIILQKFSKIYRFLNKCFCTFTKPYQRSQKKLQALDKLKSYSVLLLKELTVLYF